MPVLSDVGGWGHMDGWAWGMGAFGLVVLTVVLLVLFVPAITGPFRSTVQPTNRAIDLLGERYAKGEIDRDEYVAIKRDLERSS